MTDSKNQYGQLIDAVIAGRTDTVELAKRAVAARTIEYLIPAVESAPEPRTPDPSPNVTTTTHAPTTPPAAEPRQPQPDSSTTMSPPSTQSPTTEAPFPGPVTEGHQKVAILTEAGGIVADWAKYFNGAASDEQIAEDLNKMVDMGDVPHWLVERFAQSKFVERVGNEVEITFGKNSGFIKFLNAAVPASGDELLKIWDAEHYGVSGE